MTLEELKKELSSLSESDILSLGTVTDDIMKKRELECRRRRAEEAHKYAIGYSTSQERYYTRHPADYSKKIFRTRKEDLLDLLFEYYFPGETSAKPNTLETLFPEWLEYKSTLTDSPSTITVHEKHFHKYFEGTPLFQKPIATITVKDLNLWANQLVRDYNLSSKQWQTIKTIPKQMFEYCMDDGLIDQNPFPSMKVTVKFRQITKSKSEDQVFNSDELALLLNDLWNSFEKTHQVRFLAVMWNFFAGLRAGEVSGLMWSDVDLKKGFVTIRREVICVQREKLENSVYKEAVDNGDYLVLSGQDNRKWVYVLVNHTKTHKERTLALPDDAISLLREIPKTSMFVFADERGRILTLRQINAVLEDACVHVAKAQGVEGKASDLRKTVRIKRSHKIRKTYASTLSAAGFPIDRIREYLGHSSLQTTLGYIYDPLSENERKELLEDAFSGVHPKIAKMHPKIRGSNNAQKMPEAQ